MAKVDMRCSALRSKSAFGDQEFLDARADIMGQRGSATLCLTISVGSSVATQNDLP